MTALAESMPRQSVQPRAQGRVRLSVKNSGGHSKLDRLYQSGSAKALFPRTGARELTAVLLNTAGGVTGGDRFAYGAEAGAQSALTLTTQAAERAYRAQPGETGTVAITLGAGPGATVHWLPQETILFDAAALNRRLDVDLSEDAALLAVEPIIFGRSAMGETLANLHFTDHWRVRREGKLIYADSLRICGNAVDILHRSGVLNGAGAMASILYAAPDAESHLKPLRALLPRGAGASLIRPGVLAARLTAANGFALRRDLIPALEMLCSGPMPTVWKM